MFRAAENVVLRDYQQRDIEGIRAAFRAGHQRVLLVEPTGAGKGTSCAYMVQKAAAKGNHVQFWVNRKTLVYDMSKRLDRLGVDHGVIMSDHPRRKPWLNVHVASIDTLRRRSHLPPANLIIIDEAHFAVSDGWKQCMDRYPGAKFILMTATPIRQDGRGLEEVADYMVLGPSVQDLIDRDYLVPGRVFAPSTPDLAGVGHSGAEFNTKQLADRCDKPTLIGDMVAHWRRLARDRKTACFAVDKHHAHGIAERFRCAGVNAVPVLDDTPDDERDRIWEDLDDGDLNMVVSVGVISYGWDHPIVSAVILGRPTESLALHLQQLGRGARIHPQSGKRDFLILDHAGNTHNHGFYEDPRRWTLQGEAAGSASEKDKDGPSVSTCLKCFCTFASGRPTCPACGAPVIRQHRKITEADGELQEMRKRQAIEDWKNRQTADQRRQKFEEWRRLGVEKGYKPGWAFVKYRIAFGQEAPWDWRKNGTP